jgi:hypothetical protein
VDGPLDGKNEERTAGDDDERRVSSRVERPSVGGGSRGGTMDPKGGKRCAITKGIKKGYHGCSDWPRRNCWAVWGPHAPGTAATRPSNAGGRTRVGASGEKRAGGAKRGSMARRGLLYSLDLGQAFAKPKRYSGSV